MEIKTSTFAQLENIAKCHMMAFPDSLSSIQGHRFCRKMLEWYIVSERGVLIHAEDNGRIVGYCSGIITKKPGLPGAVTSISQYAFREFVLAFVRKPWLLFHPDNLKKRKTIYNNILLKLGIKKKKKPVEANTVNFQTFRGIVGIGVLPEYQGKGVGSLMLQEFEHMAREDGVDKIQLTVKPDNEKAIKSYIRNGWQIASANADSAHMEKMLSSSFFVPLS